MMKHEFNHEEQYRRMLETPIPRLIASLSVPTITSMLISTVYNTADTYFVSQIGTSAAAAVGVVFSLMSIIQAVGFTLGMGAGSLVSRRLGAKDNAGAERAASSAFFAAGAFGLLLMIAGLSTLHPLMRLLGATETMLPYAAGYARYILIGAPVMCSAFVLNNVLRAEGEAVLSMVGLCTGGILNILFDPLFIFTFNLGISGAALATVLSQLISFGILIRFFLTKRSIVRIHPRYASRGLEEYALIFRTGSPTFCRQGLASLSSALLNNQAAVFGDAAVAAVTIANKIYLLVRSVVIGMGQGFQPVAGYNYGAKRYTRVRKAVRFVIAAGTVACTALAVVLYFNAGSVIAWFRRDDAAVIAAGADALRYGCLVMPLLGYSTFANHTFQSLGFSKKAAFLASCRQGIFFVPLILTVPGLLGLTGVELVQPAADLLTFLISIPFLETFLSKGLPKEDAA